MAKNTCIDQSDCPQEVRERHDRWGNAMPYQLYCTKCNKHIKWLSRDEYQAYLHLQYPVEFENAIDPTQRWNKFILQALDMYPPSELVTERDFVYLADAWQKLWQQCFSNCFDIHDVCYMTTKALQKHNRYFDICEILQAYAISGCSMAQKLLDIKKPPAMSEELL